MRHSCPPCASTARGAKPPWNNKWLHASELTGRCRHSAVNRSTESEEVGVNRVGLSCGHAVRKTFVGFNDLTKKFGPITVGSGYGRSHLMDWTFAETQQKTRRKSYYPYKARIPPQTDARSGKLFARLQKRTWPRVGADLKQRPQREQPPRTGRRRSVSTLLSTIQCSHVPATP